MAQNTVPIANRVLPRMPPEIWIEALHMKDWDSLGDYEFGNTTRPILKGTVGVEHMKDSVYAETSALIKKRLGRYTTEKIEQGVSYILSEQGEPAFIRIKDSQGMLVVRRYKDSGHITVNNKRVQCMAYFKYPEDGPSFLEAFEFYTGEDLQIAIEGYTELIAQTPEYEMERDGSVTEIDSQDIPGIISQTLGITPKRNTAEAILAQYIAPLIRNSLRNHWTFEQAQAIKGTERLIE